ncbi:MAG: SLC13 family permease [Pseudomonadota bacterium]
MLSLEIIITFCVIILTLISYLYQRPGFVITSILNIAALMIIAASSDDLGLKWDIRPEQFLLGFSNQALITVLALLVMGHAITRTGILDQLTQIIASLCGESLKRTSLIILITIIIVSGFMNNIPVVVLFIPVMQTLIRKSNSPPGQWMMLISYAAILGGMLTLIGSSTNILVSKMMHDYGFSGFNFFDFSIPGIVMASCGLMYMRWMMPYLLPKHYQDLADGPLGHKIGLKETPSGHRQESIFQIALTAETNGPLDGQKSQNGFFPALKPAAILLIMRDGKRYEAPFADFTIRPGDQVIISSSKSQFLEIYGRQKGEHKKDQKRTHRTVAEAMIRPQSPLIGRHIARITRTYNNAIRVIGVERRHGLKRTSIEMTRIELGDILLISGREKDIRALRRDHHLLLLEWSFENLPKPYHAKRAVLIFALTILIAATGLLPVVVACLAGAIAMILARVITLEEAIHALDTNLIFLVAAALAMGMAMEASGGAQFLANLMLTQSAGASPAIILSMFFLLVCFCANILSTKATAVLFLPIALSISEKLGLPPESFALAVIFASNCAFASPTGYQTNLLVMAPGHYRFSDFIKAGLPLIIILWIVFSHLQKTDD